MSVYTRVTDQGVISYEINKSDDVVLQPTFSIEIPHVGSGNTVVWAPYWNEYTDVLPPGAVGSWAEAVDAVNKMGPVETTIQIYVPRDLPGAFRVNQNNPYLGYWEIEIPGGMWNLNNTMIVGPNPEGAGDDYWYYSARPTQTRLYLYTENNWSNSCRINGCRGLKNVFFRGNEESYTEINDYSELPGYEDFSCIYVSDTSIFRVGQRVMVGDYQSSSDFTGYYICSAIDAEEGCITLYNDDYDSWNGGSLNPEYGYWRVWPDTAVFGYSTDVYNDWYSREQQEFILDGVELRHYSWNYHSKWGVIHYDFDVDATLRMVNNSYVHAKTIACDADQLNVVTRDACKLGWSSFFSYDYNGYAQFHIGAGSRLVTYQNLNWDVYYAFLQGL